jgi:glutaredoxin
MERIKSYKIYGLVSCGYCRRLVDRLRVLNIPFCVEYLDGNRTRLYEMKKKYNHKTVPIVIAREIKETFVGGHDDTVRHMHKNYELVSTCN